MRAVLHILKSGSDRDSIAGSRVLMMPEERNRASAAKQEFYLHQYIRDAAENKVLRARPQSIMTKASESSLPSSSNVELLRLLYPQRPVENIQLLTAFLQRSNTSSPRRPRPLTRAKTNHLPPDVKRMRADSIGSARSPKKLQNAAASDRCRR